MPCQSYAIVARVEESIPDLLMCDNVDPYFYTRRINSKDPHWMLVGGCDHRTGTGEPLKAVSDLNICASGLRLRKRQPSEARNRSSPLIVCRSLVTFRGRRMPLW
ncbi:MAG TPA: hypothetical protein DDZ51_26885 [Planctomycetaceae bacterium]|nr:hypothetical protein [Planctomycetaceae bacterium]